MSSSVSVKAERYRDTFEAGLKSFINEARLLAQFDHPALSSPLSSDRRLHPLVVFAQAAEPEVHLADGQTIQFSLGETVVTADRAQGYLEVRRPLPHKKRIT